MRRARAEVQVRRVDGKGRVVCCIAVRLSYPPPCPCMQARTHRYTHTHTHLRSPGSWLWKRLFTTSNGALKQVASMPTTMPQHNVLRRHEVWCMWGGGEERGRGVIR